MNRSDQSLHSPASLARCIGDNSIPPILYFHDLLDSASEQSIVFVDITDYIYWFRHHARVSGIQRVIHGLIKYADLSGLDNCNTVVYCMANLESGCFAQIDPRDLCRLVEAVDGDPDITAINEIAEQIYTNSRYINRLPLKSSDILLIPGAPWVSRIQLNFYLLAKKTICFSCYCVCYDLIPIQYPEFCDSELSPVFRSSYRQMSLLADGFLCISSFSLESIREHEHRSGIIRDRRLYCSWRLGDYDDDLPSAPSSCPDSLQEIRDQLNHKDYILFVSTIEPRKNHYSLLLAWRLLSEEIPGGKGNLPALVLAGKIGWNCTDLTTQIESMRRDGYKIYTLHGLDDVAVSWLYENCAFSIMPSFVEGWGLSITESMMRGKVCLASRSSSMIEAANGIAPLVDPYSARDIKNKLHELIFQGGLNFYQDQLKQYIPVSWKESANDFYKKLACLHRVALTTKSNTSADSRYPWLFTEMANIDTRLCSNKSNGHNINFVFTPINHARDLINLPCWQPVDQSSELKPFSEITWLNFTIPSCEVVARIRLAEYSKEPQIEACSYEPNQQKWSDSPARPLPVGSDYIIYMCFPGYDRNISSRAITICIYNYTERPPMDDPLYTPKPLVHSWPGIKDITFSTT